MRTKLLSMLAVLLLSSAAFAQYCNPSYTTGTGDGDYIETVIFQSLTNYSGASAAPYVTYYNSGYVPPALNVGMSYSGTVTSGSYVPVAPAFEAYHIWVDYNQDFDFLDAGEDIGEAQTTAAGQLMNFTLDIPLTATPGFTRLRIVNAFNTTPLTPCGAYTYGETEDYDIEIVGSSGSYCLPITGTSTTGGTVEGDYINQVSLSTLNAFTGANGVYPFYSDYTSFGGSFTTSLTTNSNYNLSITSGTYSPDYYAAWIDYNNDGDFYDLNEKLGEFATTAGSQTQNINFTVPFGTTAGNKRMRVRCNYGNANMDPCATTYAYGETEDYTVNIQNPVVGYCIPNPVTGTADNDYINGVSLGTISNLNSGYTGGPNYNDYTFYSTNIAQSSNYNLTVQAGLFATDYYAAWIDYNHDNDFNDAGEKLGEFQTATASQYLTFNFSVPPSALLGNTRMRVRCVFNAPGMDPCLDYTYGETEDYSVNITSGSGPAPYCETNLQGVNCDITDAIDDVYLLNSTLFNLGTGCNGLTAMGYTIWPASGSTTTTVLRNQNYILGVTSTSTSIISVWFDWNNDGVFATSEWYQVTTSSTPNTATEINVFVPSNAYLGQIRMRVRSRAAGNLNGATDPCTQFFSGETEDYTLTVSNSTCLAPTALFGGQYVSGSSFSFFDFSSNFPTSWSWTFQGGTPATSNLQDPTNIAFNTSGGCYTVSLTVSNACGSNTYTRPCFVNITQPTACDKLMFSEYIEGSAQNKALELYNAGSTPLNMSGYTVETYSNGSTTATYTLNLNGTLASHDVYVIGDASATLSGITANTDITSNVTFFDGNEAIILKKNGVIIDKIGDIGDPSIAWWIVGSGATAEYTLVRKSTIDRPNTFWADGANEWDVYAQNTTTYLGSHNSVCGVGAAPIAAFVGNPINIQVGQSVNFTDLSLNNPTSWNWTFTGGFPNTSTLQNPTGITYMIPGCYQVSLTVANAFGNDNETVTCYINVTAAAVAPVAAFTANVFNITTGQSVNFTDLSSNNPTSWNWQFTGGVPATSTLQNPSGITYNTPGCYQVVLTASNAGGSDSETQTCYINVSNPSAGPLANFSTSNTSICAGSCISFTDASTNNPTAWNWSFPGATTSSSTQQNPSNICYNTPGTYNVTLTAINGSGSNTLTLNSFITVYAIPAANAGTNQTICSGASTQLNATGGQTYVWTPSTGLSNANVANPIASPSSTTTYNVQVTNGTCSSIASVTVTVTNLSVNAGNDVTICSGATTNLSASGGTTYSWSPTIGLTNPNAANPTAFPTATTTYTVTATSNGCSATDQVTVTVATPTISAGADVSICDGQSVQLNVNGGSNYTWSPSTGLDNPNISNPTASPTTTTSYTVTGVVAGCSTSDVILVTVNSNPVVPTISPNGIEIQSSPAFGYQWNFNGNPIPGGTLQSLFPGNPGNYTVTVFNSNGCSSTSAPYTVTTVGINTIKVDNTIEIYPNPAVNNAMITINAETNESAVIVLYNSIGELISEEKVNLTVGSNKKNINLDNLAVGIYTVKVIGNEINAVKVLVKK
ncbi:MAG TPA: GEVED domain-containing protein [Bacteroidia bacterium]|nr:GEVED domain-containing protein [Bacteroidia bacterium]